MQFHISSNAVDNLHFRIFRQKLLHFVALNSISLLAFLFMGNSMAIRGNEKNSSFFNDVVTRLKCGRSPRRILKNNCICISNKNWADASSKFVFEHKNVSPLRRTIRSQITKNAMQNWRQSDCEAQHNDAHRWRIANVPFFAISINLLLHRIVDNVPLPVANHVFGYCCCRLAICSVLELAC